MDTPSRFRLNEYRIFLILTLCAWTSISSRWMAYPPASPHHSNVVFWYRNINLFPIDYAFRPRLRGRLTLR